MSDVQELIEQYVEHAKKHGEGLDPFPSRYKSFKIDLRLVFRSFERIMSYGFRL